MIRCPEAQHRAGPPRNPLHVRYGDDIEGRLHVAGRAEQMQSDPTARELLAKLGHSQYVLCQTQSRATESAADRSRDRLSREMQPFRLQLDARRRELQEELRLRKRESAATEIHQLQRQAAAVSEQMSRLERDVDECRRQLNGLGKSQFDVEAAVEMEMVQAEIQEEDRVLSRIGEDRDKLRVESDVRAARCLRPGCRSPFRRQPSAPAALRGMRGCGRPLPGVLRCRQVGRRKAADPRRCRRGRAPGRRRDRLHSRLAVRKTSPRSTLRHPGAATDANPGFH